MMANTHFQLRAKYFPENVIEELRSPVIQVRCDTRGTRDGK